MKKTYLVWGVLLRSFCSFGQEAATAPVYKKQQLKETEIQALFSYYIQDGNHSAVTGGKGTEALTVYAPEIAITHKADSFNTVTLNTGVDVITSASTDNIDFMVSSASRVDARSHINLGYTRRLKHTGLRLGINAGLSVESDYTSLNLGVSASYTNPDGSRDIRAGLQCYFDDLRWGRIDDDYYRPVSLVYPVELRYKEWFDGYTRNSYNLSFSVQQIVSRRVRVVLSPELVYQKGILSTPFHRVYFKDSYVAKVENLPGTRWKVPVGLQVNIFATNSIIFRTYYRFYKDDLGITAHTFQVEMPVKLSPQFSVAPHVRFYTQTASRYFQPYKEHSRTETYYTSDYDLSAFNSIKTGLTLRYAPAAHMAWHYFFDAVSARYAWYKRSDGLHAHMMSLLLEFRHSKQ